MENGKLIKPIIGSVVSWLAAGFTFIEQHSAVIATLFAVVASIWTVLAARASREASNAAKALSDAQRRKLEESK